MSYPQTAISNQQSTIATMESFGLAYVRMRIPVPGLDTERLRVARINDGIVTCDFWLLVPTTEVCDGWRRLTCGDRELGYCVVDFERCHALHERLICEDDYQALLRLACNGNHV